MAFMSQDKKKSIVALAKPILKKYGIKATFAVDNHSTIVCNISKGGIDFIGNANEMVGSDHYKDNLQVNPYHYRKSFSGDALNFLSELIPVLNSGNWDKSDIQTDYFDVGWYVDVNIGKWNKPYQYIPTEK